MSARVIKNEILEFKKEFLEIKENLSFRLFLSLSLGSLFLMGCEEKLAQEPKQAPATVVDLVTPEQQREATEVARQEAGDARKHALEVKGMEIDAKKYESDQAADTARAEVDGNVRVAEIESNGLVAKVRAEADGAQNEAMMGGVFGVATVGLKEVLSGQNEAAKAEANLRAAESQQVAARMRAENEAEGIRLAHERWMLMYSDGEDFNGERNYICWGGENSGLPAEHLCSGQEGGWAHAVQRELDLLEQELKNCPVEPGEEQVSCRNGAFQNFREGLERANELPSLTSLPVTSQHAFKNSMDALNGVITQIQNGREPTFNLSDIFMRHNEERRQAVARSAGMSAATRDTGGVDSTFNPDYVASRTPETEMADLRR